MPVFGLDHDRLDGPRMRDYFHADNPAGGQLATMYHPEGAFGVDASSHGISQGCSIMSMIMVF